MFNKITKAVYLALFFVLLLSSPATAISKFETKYQVYYKVENSGKTKVSFVITQKNNLSIVYATEYGISLNETNIQNLKITDEGVAVSNPTIVNSQNQTIISFPFPNKVVGKNKTRTFTIEYEANDIASKQGNTWQINIPRFESSESISDQTAILSLPEGFPAPAYIDPKPDIVNNNTYYFSSKTTANKPISAIFGQNQYFKASIKYYLKNDLNIKNQKSITLIPNTGYQNVYYLSVEPKPLKISEDGDGNLLAIYDLSPNQEINISTHLFISTDFLPRQKNTDPQNYHKESNQIWNHDDVAFSSPEIKNLTSPKSIYDFVVSKLKYDYQKINLSGTKRQSASSILNDPLSAICTDFTDLFVALARRADIPARELEGIAISDNPDLRPIADKIDLLHAWPEYYDKDKMVWVQVDPTWANTTRGMDYFTKLDFNHIVFAIHGQTPFEPLPAGGFKSSTDTTKQIEISPTDKVDFPKASLTLTLQSNSFNKVDLKLKNETGTYFQGQLEAIENNLIKSYQGQVRVPPFSETTLSLETKPLSLFDTNQSETIIVLNGENQTVKFRSDKNTSPFLYASAGLLLGVGTLIARSLLLRRRK